jgi:cytochrome c oxidase cbb3-type subunit 3
MSYGNRLGKGDVTLRSSCSSSRAMIVLTVIFAVIGFSGRILGIGAFALGQSSKTARPQKLSAASHLASDNGDKIFATSCAGCHGLDGRGSERAPSIAVGRVQRLSDVQLFGIIEHGITGTGMPSFHSLADSDIKAVVAYLRILQGAKKTISLPGDPNPGKVLFLGKAGCSGCHMAAGQGGFIASDLSAYSRTHSVDETRSAITNPNPLGDRLARTATVTTRDGEKCLGRVRNEDNFSLQLQDLDGVFHFFAKSDIQGTEYSSQSLMPTNYGSTLSPDELNDVISYMMTVANSSESGSPKARTPKEGPEEEQ